MNNLGLEPLTLKGTDEQEYWQAQTDSPDLINLPSALREKSRMKTATRRETRIGNNPTHATTLSIHSRQRKIRRNRRPSEDTKQ